MLFLLVMLAAPLTQAAAREPAAEPGEAGAAHYSPLRQIDRTNVARLAPVWTFHTGEAASNTELPCSPLVIDGVLYGTSPKLKLFALEAARGLLLWRFDPLAGRREAAAGIGPNRGLAWWSEGRDRRLLYTANGFLHALDAATGRLIETFGDGGRIDLLAGFDHGASQLQLASSSPPAIYRDLLLISTRFTAGPGPFASGQICAYDVRTGARRWCFNTIPHPGEPGYDTWPPGAWQAPGGAGHDAGLTIDHERGLAFIPTGPAAAVFWGGHRVGANLYANCLLALDAATGRRRWHFQFVHHDLWDSGLPVPPALCTITRDGEKVPAVAQITKSGHVWVFHRETGESLFPWREQPVPASTLAGETASPTQPLPLKPPPVSRQRFTEAEVTPRTPTAHAAVLAQLRELAAPEPFTPPGPRDTVFLTAFDGSGAGGGMAVDPDGVLYVNASELAWILQMHPTRAASGVPLGQTLFLQLCAGCHGPDRTGNPAAHIPSLVNVGSKLPRVGVEEMLHRGKGIMPPFAFLTGPQQTALIAFVRGQPGSVPPESGAGRNLAGYAGDGVRRELPYTTAGPLRFLDPDGFPALRPPWGTLNALDLNTGEYRWQRPLGEPAGLTAAGLPPTGTENRGGPLVTAGGLVFIGATPDEKLRAFDATTGRQVWQFALPAGGYGTPVTYSVAGRQYVVMACGGGRMGTKPGDAYVTLALPEK